ncbi:MAG: alpha/beta fold hydrolase [Verrucomicrobiota bacterium]
MREFSYFEKEGLRPGCEPKMLVHEERAEQAVVLVHGLTDSPYFLTAIGESFFEELGYDVYLPLLQGHGLKEPRGMEGVTLAEWKKNVSWAVREASAGGRRVSVGGLSTGGVLSLQAASQNARIKGEVYLFSAALDLMDKRGGFVGDLKERLLLLGIFDTLLERQKPLIGRNPFRYAHMDLDGAHELAKLIRETDALLDGFDRDYPFPKRIFAAHSEADTTANLEGIEELEQVCVVGDFSLFRMEKAAEVAHASVVLKEPVCDPANGEELEKANPFFGEMMEELRRFVSERR